MGLTRSAGKPITKAKKVAVAASTFSKNRSALTFDLLYQLSYMSVIASAGVPRNLIFEKAAQVPCSVADYFRKIELACDRLKYDYAKACRIVGESAKEPQIRELLLRFSSSLISGEPEADFLARETAALSETYDNDYGQKLQALNLWTDAYVSLVLSAVLIIIMGIVSTMIWKVEMAFILGMVFVSTGATAMGIWLIYLMAPKEIFTLHRPGSSEQKLVSGAFKVVLAAAIASSALLLTLKVNVGWALIAVAVLIFPLGCISANDDKKVTKRDSEVGTLLASMGGVCAALGTTVKEALARIDLEALNVLKHDVKRLCARLDAGITPRLSWQRFIDETGSELVGRSVGTFYDTIDVGGEAKNAGLNAALLANRIAMLRARRKTVSSPFRWLCVAMHTAVGVLLIFVTQVIGIFGGMVADAEKSMPKVGGAAMSSFTSFNVSGLELMQSLVLPLVLILTVANALAPQVADGGSWYKLLFNLGITLAISGLALVFLPAIANTLFKTVHM